MVPDPIFPEIEVEIDPKLTVQEATSSLEMLEDGHLMVETLKACALKSNCTDSDPR